MKAIKVWEFEDAPEKYKKLGHDCGKEAYLLFVPESIDVPLWVFDIQLFFEFILTKKGTVVIGCHE